MAKMVTVEYWCGRVVLQTPKSCCHRVGLQDARGFELFVGLAIPCLGAEGAFEEVDGKRVRHGAGVFTDGVETYDGEWHADEMHGEGSYTAASGAKYRVRSRSLPSSTAWNRWGSV